MTIRILIDMNLSPDWCVTLTAAGWQARHWSAVGDSRAPDGQIMTWARENGHLVFRHDLGFATTLALTHAAGPSVLQVRGQNILPDFMAPFVLAALRDHQAQLAAGALVTVDAAAARVRLLPL